MIELRSISGYDELKLWVDARNAVRPDDAWTAEMLAVLRATEVDRIDLVALEGEKVVGTAFIAGGPVSTDERTFAEVIVRREARGRGVGGALLDAVLSRAAARSSASVEFFVRAEEADAPRFLERRGFAVEGTLDNVVFELDRPAPPAREPRGIQLTWLNDRASAMEGMFEVAHEAHAQSGGALPPVAETLHEWEAFELGDPKVAFELCAVALADERVVGYGIVQVVRDSGAAMHRMTAVLPEWRRRGIGEAMTQAQIVASQRSGLQTLEGWTRTEAIGALAEKLGYRHRRRVLVYRKSI